MPRIQHQDGWWAHQAAAYRVLTIAIVRGRHGDALPGEGINVSLPGRQTKRIGCDLKPRIEIVCIFRLNDVLEAGLLLGEGIKVSVWLGVIGVNFFEPC